MWKKNLLIANVQNKAKVKKNFMIVQVKVDSIQAEKKRMKFSNKK